MKYDMGKGFRCKLFGDKFLDVKKKNKMNTEPVLTFYHKHVVGELEGPDI